MIKSIIEYFQNGSELEKYKKECKRLNKALDEYRNVKTRSELRVGNIVYFSADAQNSDYSKAIKAKIIGTWDCPNSGVSYILESGEDYYLKQAKYLISVKK